MNLTTKAYDVLPTSLGSTSRLLVSSRVGSPLSLSISVSALVFFVSTGGDTDEELRLRLLGSYRCIERLRFLEAPSRLSLLLRSRPGEILRLILRVSRRSSRPLSPLRAGTVSASPRIGLVLSLLWDLGRAENFVDLEEETELVLRLWILRRGGERLGD